MRGNHQFSIAVHLLACLGHEKGAALSSELLSKSVNTSPSFLRRTLSKLAKAGIVRTAKGKGGAAILARDPGRISMFDVYLAVEAPPSFVIHQYPAQKSCAVSRKFKASMEKVLFKTQTAMEDALRKQSLAEVIAGLAKA